LILTTPPFYISLRTIQLLFKTFLSTIVDNTLYLPVFTLYLSYFREILMHLKWDNVYSSNIYSFFAYMIAHFSCYRKGKNNYFLIRNLILHADCYSCTHMQKSVILVLKKLLNLSFLLFKKIFFIKITVTYLKKKDKLNNRFFK